MTLMDPWPLLRWLFPPLARRHDAAAAKSEAERERVRRAQSLIAERQATSDARSDEVARHLAYLRDRARVLGREAAARDAAARQKASD